MTTWAIGESPEAHRLRVDGAPPSYETCTAFDRAHVRECSIGAVSLAFLDLEELLKKLQESR